MINITEIVQSHGWKSFMAKLYGIGAAVVIVGALFKIQHWPGSGTFLSVGLLTEAVIFFFSAFEPLHEDLDWTLVYPELAGLTDEEELQHYRKENQAMGMGMGMVSGASSGALAKFDELLEKGDIGEELFKKLGEGLKNLSKSTQNLNDISNAAVATNEFTGTVKSATESFNSLHSNYSKSAGELNESIGSLSGSYQKLSESLGQKYEMISQGGSDYTEKLESLNKNLAALNAVYELQLKGANDQMNNSKGLYEGFGEMISDLKASINETKNYRDEITKLHKNLSELNQIYGNMLSAMSVTGSINN